MKQIVETKEDVAIIACLIERFFPQLRPLLLNSSPIFMLVYWTPLLANSYFKVLLWELYHWVAFWYVLIAVDYVKYEHIQKIPQKISRKLGYSVILVWRYAFKPIVTIRIHSCLDCFVNYAMSWEIYYDLIIR